MSEPKWRHEYKYLVSEGQIEILEGRAAGIMKKDPHVCTGGRYSGFYNIRSVYFDDLYNTAYLENEDGEDPREKFRIRIYNHSDDRITLELKQKRDTKCLKTSCPLSREQSEVLIRGGCLPPDASYPPPLQKLLYGIRTRALHPVVIVEYDRIPYVCTIGNVRVTLDKNIRSCSECALFFEDEIPMRSVMITGQHILEVKWDELLPDVIYQAMMLENLQWTGFSKYYFCRRYSAGLSTCLL